MKPGSAHPAGSSLQCQALPRSMVLSATEWRSKGESRERRFQAKTRRAFLIPAPSLDRDERVLCIAEADHSLRQHAFGFNVSGRDSPFTPKPADSAVLLFVIPTARDSAQASKTRVAGMGLQNFAVISRRINAGCAQGVAESSEINARETWPGRNRHVRRHLSQI